MIDLKEITEDNFIDAFNLKLGMGQDKFVSHPIRSLAQAYVYRSQCQPFGIYNDDEIELSMTIIKSENEIHIEEISVDKIDEFRDIHFKYLVDDEIIIDQEDKDYFSGDEYRGIIKNHMERMCDKHHMVYFLKEHTRIGAAQYNTYQSEDGKCFILDFWIFPEYRNKGLGHKCFDTLERYTREDGAVYYEINSIKENSIRFWKSMGFVENGKDEYDVPLFVKR